ncbi:phage tail protein [Pseudanabaena sp. FACHB-1277]|uniref:Phage tail protein n=1 Tax=Pseudanabaena cinerea FACHB-1277 TaxID=2949581 RepID=A0A926UQ36_9CYAN|nr:phage tail protein [Pseudanabaena cinerea]MBD2148937.1 phage tail protein [Pseudanabaena cinerea FACHB-1277]
MVTLADYRKIFNMYTFGAIVEGITDFPIINSILIGYFNDSTIDINLISPISFKASSNYDKVFKSCKPEKLKRAFLANKYIIIHVDTDVSESFGVSHSEDDKPLSPQQLIDKVIGKFKQKMGEEFYSQYGHRIIFAIAVHSIECWLFPLLASNDKSEEIENCCQILEKTVPSFRKKYDYYQEITERYRNHDDLLNLYPKNPSLKMFIEQLADKNIEISEES